jgi:hypothetical protein
MAILKSVKKYENDGGEWQRGLDGLGGWQRIFLSALIRNIRSIRVAIFSLLFYDRF